MTTAEAAKFLDSNVSTVSAWVAGRHEVPPIMLERLLAVAAENAQAVAEGLAAAGAFHRYYTSSAPFRVHLTTTYGSAREQGFASMGAQHQVAAAIAVALLLEKNNVLAAPESRPRLSEETRRAIAGERV